MNLQRGPWQPAPQPPWRGRLILWLAVLAAGWVALSLLEDMFPGRVSDTDRGYFWQKVGVLALVASGVLYARRVALGEVARNLAIWAAIVAVLALGFTYQNELRDVALRVRSELIPGYPVSVGATAMRLTEGVDRHFHVFGEANGTTVDFMIDTGASDIVLSPADARRIGIEPGTLSFTKVYQTANGVGRGAPLTLRTLSIGPIELRNVAVSVNQADMGSSLLGMAFLRNLAAVEIQGREMVLRWR